jgi:predicted nucleic acid-binding protein
MPLRKNMQLIDTNIWSALKFYHEKNIDFVDALLCSHRRLLGDKIYTFDEKLKKLIKID